MYNFGLQNATVEEVHVVKLAHYYYSAVVIPIVW